MLYENGNGTEQDYSKAIEHYELSAKQGDLDALVHLGLMHVFVNGFEKSYSKAKEYFERAMKDNSNALFNLAEIYVNGYGVPKDYELAKHLYQIYICIAASW